MNDLSPAHVSSLRDSFQKLRSVADSALAALGPDKGSAIVDLDRLKRANEKLRQLAALILATQDQEER